jgi:hypothetical protein
MRLLFASDASATGRTPKTRPKPRGLNSPLSREFIPTSNSRKGEDNPQMPEQADIDPVHQRIVDRIEELGLTAHAVSLAADLDKSYLRKLLKTPGSRPGVEAFEAIASVLKTTVSALMGRDHDVPAEVPIKPDYIRLSDSLPPVPIRGTVAGSHESGAFQFDGSDVDTIERYPALVNRPRVYALYVEGDSMVPEHKPGAIRFVDPAATVRQGDTVVVTVRDIDRGLFAVLGNLVRRGDQVVLGKLNPPREISFDRLQVHSIHHVLTDNELAGLSG